MAYLCFQGELSGFENKDSFYKELKEEERSNGALGEPTEAKRKTHDRAWGRHDRAAGLEMWHGPQHGRATNRAWTDGHTHGRACDRAPTHGRPCGPARSCIVGRSRFITWFRLIFGDSFLF